MTNAFLSLSLPTYQPKRFIQSITCLAWMYYVLLAVKLHTPSEPNLIYIRTWIQQDIHVASEFHQFFTFSFYSHSTIHFLPNTLPNLDISQSSRLRYSEPLTASITPPHPQAKNPYSQVPLISYLLPSTYLQFCTLFVTSPATALLTRGKKASGTYLPRACIPCPALVQAWLDRHWAALSGPDQH